MNLIGELLFLLTDNGAIEVIKILNSSELKKKYKRKEKRNLKSLAKFEDFK